MENTTNDKATKGILANSFIELNDPGFTGTVMQKIEMKRNRKAMIQNAVLYFFIIIAIEVVVFLLIRSQHPDFSGFASLPGKLGDTIIFNMIKLKDIIYQNGYLVLPFIVVLIFKKILESRLRYS